MAGNRFGQQQQRVDPAPGIARPVREPDQKYTLILSQNLRRSLDEDCARLRRDGGVRASWSDAIRALIRQLHADESLYDAVLADLVDRANAD